FRFLLIILLIAFSVSCFIISSLVREIESPPTRAALSFTSNFENRYYDCRMTRSLDSSKKSKDIVLATVDDPSIKTIGRYPWPRAVWAQIIDNLKNYGAKVLAFDVMFSEE